MITTERNPCDELIIGANPSLECAKQSKKWVLITAILGSSMAFINGSVVNVALPAIQSAFNGSVADIQWIVNGYAIILAALILVGGSLGDIYGRKKIFGIGAFIFLIASVWSGLSPDIFQLIIARALQGAGGALLVPNSLALISSAYPKKERGKAIGTWSAFSAITTAIGPVLGGWLVDSFSWRPVFYISVPVALLAIGILLVKVPEFKSDDSNQRLDWPGAILATLGFGITSFGLIQASELGFSNPLVMGSIVSGLVLIALFIVQEKRSSHPMMPLNVFNSKAFSGINLVTLIIYFALSSVFFFLPFNLIQVQGYSATEAGAAFLPFTLIMGFFARWTGAIGDRYGNRVPLVIGPVLTAIAYYTLSLPGISENFWTSFFPGLTLMGLGMAMTVPPLTTTVMNAVQDSQTGIASGINNSVSRLAGMLAVAILGVVAVQIFSSELMLELSQVELPEELVNSIQLQQTKLAGISLDPGFSGSQLAIAQNVVHQSFISSFQWVMRGSALIALLGAFLAWITLKEKTSG